MEEQIREMELQHVRDMDALKAEYEEQMENQRQQMEEQLQQEREAMAQHAAHVQVVIHYSLYRTRRNDRGSGSVPSGSFSFQIVFPRLLKFLLQENKSNQQISKTYA